MIWIIFAIAMPFVLMAIVGLVLGIWFTQSLARLDLEQWNDRDRH